ncbi:unnamed protein product [Dicrocoelium dendriticum]|nr:unnamed protein product [Dicrocoelium dendriticum]
MHYKTDDVLVKKRNIRSKLDYKWELTQQQKDDIFEAFNFLDADGNGLVQLAEIKVALRALCADPSTSDLRRLSAEYSKDKSGALDFTGFLEIMTKAMMERDSEEELSKAFRLFDAEGSGCITFDKLKRAAQILGEDVTDEEIQEMIDEADKSGKGAVTEKDFIRILRKSTTF